MAKALMRTLPVRSNFDVNFLVQTANSSALSGETHRIGNNNRRNNNDTDQEQTQNTTDQVHQPKRWRPNRDSLARRRKHGKVGSRRHRRYLNNLYLNDVNYWDGEYEDIMAVQDMLTWHPDYTSVFEELFEDEATSELWDDFRFVDEGKQSALLLEICGELPNTHSRRFIFEDPLCEEATQKFLMIEKETRHLLKQTHNNRLIQAIELKLLPIFMKDSSESLQERFAFFDAQLKDEQGVYFTEWSKKKNSKNDLVLLMKSSRDRKVIHGVCTFYGLVSKSQNTKSGNRTTVIQKSKSFSPLLDSSMLLSAYLQVLLSDS